MSNTTPDTAIAELKTDDGTFLIQERRRAPRADRGSAPETPPPMFIEQRGSSSSPAMTALGGIIILMVLIGSYTAKYEAAIGHTVKLAVPAIGFLALQLFLARSAYRLFFDIRKVPSVGAYVQSRLLRYLPASIPAVLIGFILSKAAGIACFHSNLSDIPANLFMMADMLGVSDVDPSHWRLKIEILLSAFIGMIWFTRELHYLPMILLPLLGFDALCVHGEPVRETALSVQGFLTIDGYLPLVAFGLALYHLVQDTNAKAWWLVALLSAVLVFFSNTVAHGAASVAALIVLSGIATGRLDFVGKATWLVRLGEIAFPVYVVHQVMGYIVIQKLEALGLHPVAAMLVAAALAVAAGKALQIAFERPADLYVPGAVAWLRRTVEAKLPVARLPQSA